MARSKRINIGVLISGTGSNMKAIVEAGWRNEIKGEVVFVGSDNPDAKGLKWAHDHHIPVFSVDFKQYQNTFELTGSIDFYPYQPDLILASEVWKRCRFVHNRFGGDKAKQLDYLKWKIAAEIELVMKIKEFKIDLLVLAGYMQNCTPYFIDSFNRGNKLRIMNIHPALLPAFPGTDGYGDTIRYGCKIAGCTVHFIDYGEDSGPIIGQRAIPVLYNETVKSLRKRGLEEEYRLYPECIRLFAEGRLRVVEQKQRNGQLRRVVKFIKPRKRGQDDFRCG